MTRSTADYIRIAGSGGGLVIDASTRSAADMIRIAGAARASGSQVTFTRTSTKSAADLIRVGGAGKGCVIFED